MSEYPHRRTGDEWTSFHGTAGAYAELGMLAIAVDMSWERYLGAFDDDPSSPALWPGVPNALCHLWRDEYAGTFARVTPGIFQVTKGNDMFTVCHQAEGWTCTCASSRHQPSRPVETLLTMPLPCPHILAANASESILNEGEATA